MLENNLYQKSYAFAVEIILLYKQITEEKREYILSKQLVRSGTSIGANVAEANGAISTADFSSKVSIAYKESLETKYWLNLLKDTEYIERPVAENLILKADELSRIMFSILKKTRMNSK